MFIEAALLPRNLSSHLLFHFITVPVPAVPALVPLKQKVTVPTVPVPIPQHC